MNTTSGVYDLEFRNYDPALARMNQVDPMAHKYSSTTPYNYSFNNPVTLNDPNGAEPVYQDYYYQQESAAQARATASLGYAIQSNNIFARVNRPFGSSMSSQSFAQADTYFAEKNAEMVAEAFIKEYLKIDVDVSAGYTYSSNVMTGYSILPNHINGDPNTGNIYAQSYNLITKTETSSVVREGYTPLPWFFDEGFMHPENAQAEQSNFINMSGAVGGWGMLASAAEYSLIAESKFAQGTYYTSAATMRSQAKAGAKFLGNKVGPTFGLLGVTFSSFESAYDANGYSPGDKVKTGIGLTMVGISLTGVGSFISTGYGLLDMYVGLKTGYSITDRIGIGVDYSWNH